MARQRRSTIKHLSQQEIERFFRVMEDPRDRAMFRLAYHRGLRASEVGMLQYSDLREDDKIEIGRLKGSTGGLYRMCRSERLAVHAWLRKRGSAPGPLFPSRNGTPVSRQRLDFLMRRYGKLANLPPDRCHMHVLKHSCATHLFDKGESLEDVQDHLGHRNIQNTLVYAAFSNQRRQARERRLEYW